MGKAAENTRWWVDDASSDVLDAWVRTSREASADRMDAIDLHCALYGSQPRGMILRSLYAARGNEARLRFNVISSIVDTLQSQIGETRPKPSLLTDKGDWSQRRRALQVERAIEGDFEHNAVYTDVAPMTLLDAEVTGTGCSIVRPEAGRVVIERTDPAEIVIDPIEARYGKPRTFAWCRKVQRAAVREMFPDVDDSVIRKAQAVSAVEFGYTTASEDLVEVIYAVRVGDDQNKGREVLALRGGGWLREPKEWKRKRLPVSFLHWRKRISGFWGQGIPERVAGLQYEVNLTLKKIQKSMELSTSRILVPDGAKISAGHITNDPQDIIYYQGGQAPTFSAVTSVPPELIAHVDRTVARAYEQEGVSMLSASSMKPAGLNSGEAQRVYLDNEAGRQLIPIRNYEAYFLDLADAAIDCHDMMQDEGTEQVIRCASRKWIKPVNWDEVALDRESYVLKVAAASALPRGTAGRTATIEGWAAAGWLTREQALQLLQIPDTDDFLDTELAPMNVVLEAIEHMSETEEYRPPNPNQDLALTMKLTNLTICRFESEGAPQTVLELLHTYFDDARAMLEMASQPQQPQDAQGMPASAPAPQAPAMPAN